MALFSNKWKCTELKYLVNLSRDFVRYIDSTFVNKNIREPIYSLPQKSWLCKILNDFECPRNTRK